MTTATIGMIQMADRRRAARTEAPPTTVGFVTSLIPGPPVRVLVNGDSDRTDPSRALPLDQDRERRRIVAPALDGGRPRRLEHLLGVALIRPTAAIPC